MALFELWISNKINLTQRSKCFYYSRHVRCKVYTRVCANSRLWIPVTIHLCSCPEILFDEIQMKRKKSIFFSIGILTILTWFHLFQLVNRRCYNCQNLAVFECQPIFRIDWPIRAWKKIFKRVQHKTWSDNFLNIFSLNLEAIRILIRSMLLLFNRK